MKPQSKFIGSRPELRPAPSPEWEAEYIRLMRDPHLAKKYDREARLIENINYIRDYCPCLTQPQRGTVVDVGPGAGEFLEWCRLFGSDTLAVDSPDGQGGMGAPYVTLSRMMHERQGIDAVYCGWREWLPAASPPPGATSGLSFVNFRGSFAQCYSDLTCGPPHHEHHNAQKQWWRFDSKLIREWRFCFESAHDMLLPNGQLLISANRLGGRDNQRRYESVICKIAAEAGFRLELHIPMAVHRWRKS